MFEVVNIYYNKQKCISTLKKLWKQIETRKKSQWHANLEPYWTQTQTQSLHLLYIIYN